MADLSVVRDGSSPASFRLEGVSISFASSDSSLRLCVNRISKVLFRAKAQS